MRSTCPNVSDRGRMVAHRGASRVAPENTLSAFRAAAAQGVYWAEFDVTLLGDGTAVVHHDQTLDRCTTATGPLAQINAGDLSAISAGQGHGPDFSAEPLPTLDQVLALLAELNFYANLEIKRHDLAVGAVSGAVTSALERSSFDPDRIIISSFDLDELARTRRLLPDWPIAALFTDPPDDWRRQVEPLGAAALHVRYDCLSQSFLTDAVSLGYDVRVYTINVPNLMVPFRDLGLTGVITDHPPLFLDDPGWADWAKT